MNKDVLKIISIFFILIIVLSNFSYAETPGEFIAGYFTHGTNSDPSNPNKPASVDPKALRGSILDILTYIGYGLALCVIMVTGIQFLTANAQKKAQLKEKLWLIAIGVIILAAGIPIYETLKDALMDLR